MVGKIYENEDHIYIECVKSKTIVDNYNFFGKYEVNLQKVINNKVKKVSLKIKLYYRWLDNMMLLDFYESNIANEKNGIKDFLLSFHTSNYFLSVVTYKGKIFFKYKKNVTFKGYEFINCQVYNGCNFVNNYVFFIEELPISYENNS